MLKLAILIALIIITVILMKAMMSTKFDIDSNTLKEMLKENPSLLLIDVRTEREYAGGTIKDAKNIPLHSPDWQKFLGSAPQDKHYIVFCQSGMRSAQACKIMEEKGFEHLSNLKGGILSYRP